MVLLCVFEYLQCWAAVIYLSSQPLDFPILTFVKVFLLSDIIPTSMSSLVFVYCLCDEKNTPFPLGNVKIACIYSYLSLFSLVPLFLVFTLPIRLRFLCPSFSVLLSFVSRKIKSSSEKRKNQLEEGALNVRWCLQTLSQHCSPLCVSV